MSINVDKLNTLYQNPAVDGGWLIIGNSKENIIKWGIGAAEGENGTPNTAWKIHISIAPDKMTEAVNIIGQILQDDDSPKVTIKFTHPQQAFTGQPSKQVAFKFYAENLNDTELMKNFLERIDSELCAHGIGLDSRPINADLEKAKTKFDAPILHADGSRSRFNYRFEDALVMNDALYKEVGGTGNIKKAGNQRWVKQSHYMSLPDSQKHNPSNEHDPFENLRPKVYEEISNSNHSIVEPSQESLKTHETTHTPGITSTPQDKSESNGSPQSSAYNVLKIAVCVGAAVGVGVASVTLAALATAAFLGAIVASAPVLAVAAAVGIVATGTFVGGACFFAKKANKKHEMDTENSELVSNSR